MKNKKKTHLTSRLQLRPSAAKIALFDEYRQSISYKSQAIDIFLSTIDENSDKLRIQL